MARLIENEPTNPCIGCGPANPMGLKLAFEEAPEGARTSFVAHPNWQGFPGRMHSAVLYLALIETMNWSLYAATSRMGLPTRTSALTMTRRVHVGDTVVLHGRLVARDESARTAHVEARATTLDGTPVGALDRNYLMVDEDEFLARMGYDELPAGYEAAFGE